MRTTLILDDGLVRRAKRRALERNQTLSDVVNEALRDVLRETPAAPTPFSMVTYGQSARRVHHEPAGFAAVGNVEDLEQQR